MVELNPLMPPEPVPEGLRQTPVARLVDQLDIASFTVMEARGVGAVGFQFASSDPEAPWPLPITFVGRPDDLRKMGRIVQQAAFRAANLAEGKP